MDTHDPHSTKQFDTHSMLSVAIGTLIGLAAVGAVLLIWHNHHNTGGTSASLTQTYCSNTGKVCVSYPKSWHLDVNSNNQASLTDPSTGVNIHYSPQLYSASDPCGPGSCRFKTLSAVISSGFSNADDIAGVFQYGKDTFVPEYFLVATKQLLSEGLGSVGTTIDVGQTSLNLGFINGSLSKLNQTLEVEPSSSISFTTLAAAQNWLSSSSAKTAITIVNSARPQS